MPLEFADKWVSEEIVEKYARDEITGEFSFEDEFKLLEDKFKRADQDIVGQISDE